MTTEWTEIEKNVPIPEMKVSVASKYRFGEMEIGDSVFFKGDKTMCKKHNQAAHAFGSMRRKKITDQNGNLTGGWMWQFITRQMDGGIRIWRKS